jgi:hypothetical protein
VTDKQKLSLLVRSLTLGAAQVAFVALVTSFVLRTWEANAGIPPTLPTVQVDAAGGLALILGGGYALVLGTQGGTPESTGLWRQLKSIIGERALLFCGVIIYMLAGFAICFTYAVNEAETPAILKTIAVGFSGYVVAYISTAYQQLS